MFEVDSFVLMFQVYSLLSMFEDDNREEKCELGATVAKYEVELSIWNFHSCCRTLSQSWELNRIFRHCVVKLKVLVHEDRCCHTEVGCCLETLNADTRL